MPELAPEAGRRLVRHRLAAEHVHRRVAAAAELEDDGVDPSRSARRAPLSARRLDAIIVGMK